MPAGRLLLSWLKLLHTPCCSSSHDINQTSQKQNHEYTTRVTHKQLEKTLFSRPKIKVTTKRSPGMLPITRYAEQQNKKTGTTGCSRGIEEDTAAHRTRNTGSQSPQRTYPLPPPLLVVSIDAGVTTRQASSRRGRTCEAGKLHVEGSYYSTTLSIFHWKAVRSLDPPLSGAYHTPPYREHFAAVRPHTLQQNRYPTLARATWSTDRPLRASSILEVGPNASRPHLPYILEVLRTYFPTVKPYPPERNK